MQSFVEIRKGNMLYVDKTGFIPPLLSLGKYIFLGRPRRFGKSLFMSTLETYFKGMKEYFTGLEICKQESDWYSYPVIHLDFSTVEASSPGMLRENITTLLKMCAAQYEVQVDELDHSVGLGFRALMQRLSEKFGRNTVVLIDEYDVPVHGISSDSQLYHENSNLLRTLLQQCKAADQYIKFCFVTGVARFNQVNLFSGPNNFRDISLHEAFSSVCGFTHKELEHYFGVSIDRFAAETSSPVKTIKDKLASYYDGYRFTEKDEKVFNPLSLLLSLSDHKFDSYWANTGITSLFITHLTKQSFQLPEITEKWYEKEALTKIYDPSDPVSLMFQTGYLTVADFDRELDMYRMRIPNQEVMKSLTQDLIPAYMGKAPDSENMQLSALRIALVKGEPYKIKEILQDILSGIAYHLFPKGNTTHEYKENYYHTMVYLVFMMIRSNVLCEKPSAKGRMDMVAQTEKYIYIFEFKMDSAMDGTAQDAIKQINQKEYARQYENTGKKIFKIGVVFSATNHDIAEWVCAEN